VKDIWTYSDPEGIGWLDFYGNGNVVLSPAVMDHWPWRNCQISHQGFVEFDCELQTQTASNVIMLTSMDPYGPQLENVRWAHLSNHRIEFDIPDLREYCWADFLVDPSQVMSFHNQIHLDGNTNPPNRNSTGPNGDFYNWTGRNSRPPMIDFEDGEDRAIIGDCYAPDEVQFPGGYCTYNPEHRFDWRFRSPCPRSNVYPFHASTDYPMYWIDGTLHAWMGDFTGHPVWAWMTLSNGGASAICLGVTSSAFATISAWNHGIDLLLCTDAVQNPILQGVPSSHSLRQVRLQAQPPNEGVLIDSITVTTYENTFGVDNMMVSNLSSQGFGLVPRGYDVILNKPGDMYPGGDAITYPFSVEQIVDSLEVHLNWYQEQDLEMSLEVKNPLGESVFQAQSGTPPIMVDPIIFDPMAGEWQAKVAIYCPNHILCHFKTFASVRYEPLVDGYIAGADDIKWYPSSPELGDRIYICATVQSGNQFDKNIYYLPVRCYLGNPDQGIRIDIDEYVFDLVPGGADSVYF